MPAAQEYTGGSSTHFTPGESAYVACRRHHDSPPALLVRLGEGASFIVALDDEREITEGQMRFARDLHAASQTYLTECERLRAAARDPRRSAAQHVRREDAHQ